MIAKAKPLVSPHWVARVLYINGVKVEGIESVTITTKPAGWKPEGPENCPGGETYDEYMKRRVLEQ
jgi:hypothetical protein